MKIHAGQIYIQPNVRFPFSVAFQRWLSAELSQSTKPSVAFSQTYGEDFDLMFRISAKAELTNCEICGPTVFRKTGDVEFTVFLPFTVIQRKPEPIRAAIEFLIDGILSVFERLGIDTTWLERNRDAMVEHVVTDDAMLKPTAGRGPRQ